MRGRTVTLKVKFADFQQITRSRTLGAPVASASQLTHIALELLASLMPAANAVRLLGVTLSSLEEEGAALASQLRLAL